jgi:hypothetical protein
VARLSCSAARTFYNAADAIVRRGGGAGDGDRDLVPALEARLARWGASRRIGLALLLHALEWQPRLALRGGFSWLPWEERARLLGGWEESRLPPRRAAGRALRRLVEELAREVYSRDGA